MSGYRLIHREQLLGEDTAVWSLVSTPLICRRSVATTDKSTATSEALSWRLWAGCSDGLIRTYKVNEVSLAQKESSLTASALSFGEQPTHILKPSAAKSAVALGCASLSILRNYAGEDDAAGNVVVAGMDLAGIARLWELDENFDQDEGETATDKSSSAVELLPTVELTLPQATGTSLALAPPRSIMPDLKCLLIAVAFLDGSVSLVSTGIKVPTAVDDGKLRLPEAGTVVQSWSPGAPLACRLVFRPNMPQLAVSRQDGTIDLVPISSSASTEESKQRLHRLSQLATAPSRALSFTTDGSLLVAGNDQGRLMIWDVARPSGVPAVVNHQVEATAGSSWLWQLSPLDGRRFLSLATDRTIRVWQVDQIHHQPLHSFTSSDDIRLWSISGQALESNHNPHPPRMVAGSENGWLQVYSLVEKV